MPMFIAGLVLPYLVSSPIWYAGPNVVQLGGLPTGSSRMAFAYELTRTHPGVASDTARAIAAYGMQLLTAARAIDAAGGAPAVEAVPPDELPYAMAGHCLEPLVAVDAEFWPDGGASEIVPGDIVVTTWRGVLWKMAKVYLGRTPDGAAAFWQNNPETAYEVPIAMITHAAKVTIPNVADALPPAAKYFMSILDGSPAALPREASANDGHAIVINELIETIRALPEHAVSV
jgi:hypothetical protein